MATTLTREDLQDDLYLFTIHGDLDAMGALAIQDDVESYAAAHPARCIIDLSEVNFMGSYGLRVLLSVAKLLSEGGGELHVAGPMERVSDVLATSGYDALFPVHTTLEAAKSHMGV